MQSCGLLQACGVFRTSEKGIAPVCRFAIKTFRREPRQAECARKALRRTNSTRPPDAMLPAGTFLLE